MNKEQIEILLHTSRSSRFVSDPTTDLIELSDAGLLYDHGPQAIAGGMHCYVTTMKGRKALNSWHATQQKPKPPTRAQRRYSDWLSGPSICFTFGQWLKAGCPRA